MNRNRRKFIAYFDILGYRNRVADKSIDEEYEIQKNFIDELRKFTSDSREVVKCKVFNFSDIYILYTDDVSMGAFSKIIRSSLLFMVIAVIRHIPYLPLRGAVTYGDFIADVENRIVIGEGLREAYELEKEQEWMGCCLSDLCYEQVKNYKIFNDFLERGVLVKYPVPFKKKIEDKYVINMESFPRIWGKETKNMPVTKPDFIENIFKNKGMYNKNLLKVDTIIRKVQNSQKFFRDIEQRFKKTEKNSQGRVIV